MDERIALHTAARRYCLQQVPSLDPRWQERWYRDRRWIHDLKLREAWEQADATEKRGEFLQAMLFHIEQCVPEDFPTLDALRTALIERSHTAIQSLAKQDNIFHALPDQVHVQQRSEERTLFQAYLEALSAQDVQDVAPLPYRRVLRHREQEKIWQRLKRRWGLTPHLHWHPLQSGPLPPHVLAFQEAWFAHAIPPEALRQILRQRRIRRVWELREAGIFPMESGIFPQYEMDLAYLIPWDGGGEHCWTSQKMDWLLYTSHESSVTVAGEWFLNLVKQAWPAWEEHLYDGPMYQKPPYDSGQQMNSERLDEERTPL